MNGEAIQTAHSLVVSAKNTLSPTAWMGKSRLATDLYAAELLLPTAQNDPFA